MSATTSSAFAIAFTALLGAPVAASVMARLTMRLPKALQTHAYLALAGLPLAVAAMSWGGLSSPIYQVNALAVLAAFWAFLALAVSAFRFGSRWLRYTLGPLSILLLALSLFAGTLGGLGTVFIVGDTVPVFTATQAQGGHCEVTSYGNATTDFGGLRVVITTPVPLLPLLERTVTDQSFEKTRQTPAQLCQGLAPTREGPGGQRLDKMAQSLLPHVCPRSISTRPVHQHTQTHTNTPCAP